MFDEPPFSMTAITRNQESQPGMRATMEVHFKLFGTDGVSLQSQELGDALRKRGWRVHACASDVPADSVGLKVPQLSYQSDEAIALRESIFAPSSTDPNQTDAARGTHLIDVISTRANAIRQPIEDYIQDHAIGLVHIRNLMSLPYNLPATLAFYRLAKERPDIHFVMQHHDFYWEGPNAKNFRTPYVELAQLIDEITCPDLPNATHVLINPIAAQALRDRRGIQGAVIPDGFDFDREVATIDEVAFRYRLEIIAGDQRPVTPNDVVVAMPARIAINKAIELAIQFVAALDKKRTRLELASGGVGAKRREFGPDNRIVLLLPQGEDLNESRAYFDRLTAYAQRLGITFAFGGHIVVPDRKFRSGDTNHYPFYSTYQAVDFVCYCPEHEGFGNQAIEAVWARLPLAVLEYPVFRRFVRDHIPHFISLGQPQELGRTEMFGGLHVLSEATLEQAVDDAISILTDHDRERRWTLENAQTLREFCGIDNVVRQYIRLYDMKGGESWRDEASS